VAPLNLHQLLTPTLSKQGCHKTPCVPIPANQEEMLSETQELTATGRPSYCFTRHKLRRTVSTNYG